jgi:hypothetical protein
MNIADGVAATAALSRLIPLVAFIDISLPKI